MVNLDNIIEPAVVALGFELVGVESVQDGSTQVVRVYVDGPNGIGVDDLAQLSRQISAVLDVEDPLSGAYRLEVSSPGIERGLFKLAHFESFIGHKVKVRLKSAVEGRRNVVAMLSRVDNQDIWLDTTEGEIKITYSNVAKARLVVDF